VDLTKVGAIVTAFAQFVTNHSGTVSTELTTIGLSRAFSDGYDKAAARPTDSGWFVDMAGYLSLFAAGVPDSAINTTLSAISAAVIASRHGAEHPQSYGISLFMPLNQNEGTVLSGGDVANDDYHTTAFSISTGWGGYLDSYITALNTFRSSAPLPSVTISGGVFTSGSNYALSFSETGSNTTAVTERILIPQTSTTAMSVSEGEIHIGATGSLTALWDGKLLVLTDGSKSDFMDTIPLGVGTGLYLTHWALTLPGKPGPLLRVLVKLQIAGGGSSGSIESCFLVDPTTGEVAQIDLTAPALVGATVQQINRVFDMTTGAATFTTSSVVFTVSSVTPFNLTIGNAVSPSGTYDFEIVGYDFGGRSSTPAFASFSK
jgi:hypothetical protein